MRIAGWVLLVAGFVLCVSIDWATLGFLWMGVGLLALQVADNKSRRAIASTSHEPSDKGLGAPEVATGGAQASYKEAESPALRLSPRESYDRQAWGQLVESDPDLSKVTAILADYGKQYVDELATEYLASLDKQRLPEIVDEIIRRARRGAPPPVIAKFEGDIRLPRQTTSSAAASQNTAPSAMTTLVELAKQVASNAAVQKAYPGKQSGQPDYPISTATSADHGSAEIDEDLLNMVSKFAPDPAFVRRKG